MLLGGTRKFEMYFHLLFLFCGVAFSANVDRIRREIRKNLTENELIWENCMMEPTIELKELSLTPLPINLPGQLKVNMKARFKQPVTNLIVKVDIERKTYFDFGIPIPCFNNLGSCTYRDVCSLIQRDDETVAQARQMFMSGGMPPRCPFPAKTINIENYLLTIPPLQYSVLSYAVSGRYKLEASFIEQSTGQPVGCVRMEVSIGGEATKPTPVPDSDATTCDGWFWC